MLKLFYEYKNTSLLFLGILIAIILSKNDLLHGLLLRLGSFDLVSAFVAGIFLTSTFSVAAGLVILITLAEKFNPLLIGVLASLGTVVGDFLIFRFVKNDLFSELQKIYYAIDRNRRSKSLFEKKSFKFIMPLIGAFIIASPLPDEVGVSLLGLSKVRTFNFLLLTFLLNAFGVFFLISVAVSLF